MSDALEPLNETPQSSSRFDDERIAAALKRHNSLSEVLEHATLEVAYYWLRGELDRSERRTVLALQSVEALKRKAERDGKISLSRLERLKDAIKERDDLKNICAQHMGDRADTEAQIGRLQSANGQLMAECTTRENEAYRLADTISDLRTELENMTGGELLRINHDAREKHDLGEQIAWWQNHAIEWAKKAGEFQAETDIADRDRDRYKKNAEEWQVWAKTMKGYHIGTIILSVLLLVACCGFALGLIRPLVGS